VAALDADGHARPAPTTRAPGATLTRPEDSWSPGPRFMQVAGSA
jgi:hypothetical protein